MLDFTLTPTMKKVANVTASDFGAYTLCSESARPSVRNFENSVRLQNGHDTREAWKLIRTICPQFYNPIKEVKSQHYIIKHRNWQKRSGILKLNYCAYLWRIPKNKFVYTESFHGPISFFSVDTDWNECAFWVKIIMGMDFARQNCLEWWWPAVEPEKQFNENGAKYRQIKFVFDSETDAIIFTSYMDTL